MRESEIERYLVKRVMALGGEIRKLRWIGRRGAPDRVVMLPGGHLWWIELKRPSGTAEAHQAREHARMLKMGQVVVVVDSLELVDEVLE
jgi:hypothetical protein